MATDSDTAGVSKSGGIQERFSSLDGCWQGVTRTWFEPGVLADESPTQATFRLLLDGRFHFGFAQCKPAA